MFRLPRQTPTEHPFIIIVFIIISGFWEQIKVLSPKLINIFFFFLPIDDIYVRMLLLSCLYKIIILFHCLPILSLGVRNNTF